MTHYERKREERAEETDRSKERERLCVGVGRYVSCALAADVDVLGNV